MIYRQDNDQAVTKKVTYKTFDYPYTQFRLYQLLKESDFPIDIIHGEAIKVINLMTTLRRWLTMHHLELSPEDLKKAESRMDKCMEYLKSDAMFAQVI